jgi:hypothetical protein
MEVEPVSVRKPLSEGASVAAVVALVVAPAAAEVVVVVVDEEDVDTSAQAVALNSKTDVSNAEIMHFILLFIVFLLFIDGFSIPSEI